MNNSKRTTKANREAECWAFTSIPAITASDLKYITVAK